MLTFFGFTTHALVVLRKIKPNQAHLNKSENFHYVVHYLVTKPFMKYLVLLK